MEKKEKIAISISADILHKVDARVDKIKYKNRSHVIESFIRQGLELKNDVGAIIVAHENRWEGNYPFTSSKSLIVVDGKTLIEKHIESLEKAHIGHVLITISPETDDIRTYFENKTYKCKIEFLEVDSSSDSGKILLEGKKILQSQKILFILGDNYFYNLEYIDLIYCHNNSNSNLTIVIKPDSNGKKLGNIDLQGNRIAQFREKPKSSDQRSYIVNTGVYIIDESIILHKKGNYKLEYDFFPQYIDDHGAQAYFHNGPWFHVQSDEVVKQLT